MPRSCRGIEALTAPLRGPAARTAPAFLGVLLTALALAFVRRYAVDWFSNDDIATLRWFAAADDGRLGPWGILDLWNNEHPVGAQFAALWLARRVLGLDMKVFVGLSVCIVALMAAIAARLAADVRDPLPARLAAVAACFALAFQPTQMEHLLWSFEIGWFLVNAVVVANVALAERFGPRAAGPAVLLCAAASLASAQGAFAFVAAGAHQALLPARRGRGAAALVLGLGAALAMGHLFWQTHPSASAGAPPGHDVARIAVYALSIVGGLFGMRDHAAALACGLALVGVALLLLWLRRGTSRPDRYRAALVTMGFSALCVGAFVRGRYHLGVDWATASFHPAPLLVPFALGLAVLLGAPAPPSRPATRRFDAGAAALAASLLAASVVTAWPYGLTRAQLWAMDQGYARWATCSGQAPESVAARASGVDYDVAEFRALRPLILRMCGAPAGPLEAALVRRPPLFDALAAGRPEVDRALDALWQDYATSLGLQLAFKPWRPDTPARLLAFARTNAEKGSELDPARLADGAAVYRSLVP